MVIAACSSVGWVKTYPVKLIFADFEALCSHPSPYEPTLASQKL